MYTKSKYNIIYQLENQIILFNTFTQAIISLENNTFLEYENLNLDSPYKKDFISLGFWIDETRDEFLELKHETLTSVYQTNELYITIKLTTDCNFRCIYCYQEHQKEYLSDLNLEVFKKFILNKIDSGIKKIHISYFGGEPLLKIDTILEIESFLSTQNIEYFSSITTNGYLLNEHNLNLLNSTNITEFQITIDGSRTTHNKLRPHVTGGTTYDTILKNIVLLKKIFSKETTVIIRCNISKANKNEFPLLLKELDYIGLTNKDVCFAINKTEDINNEQNNELYYSTIEEYSAIYLEIYDQLIKWGKIEKPYNRINLPCAANAKNYFILSPNLEIETCTSSDFKIGFIDEKGIEQYTNNTKNINTCLYFDFLPTKCTQCQLLPLCLGGCELLKSQNKETCIYQKYIIEPLIYKYLNAIS